MVSRRTVELNKRRSSDVRFGSKAALLSHISLMAAFECIADAFLAQIQGFRRPLSAKSGHST